MPFDGSEGSQITLPRAVELSGAYRKANPDKSVGIFLGRDILTTLLEQPECQGIRFSFGLDSTEAHLVAVSADSNENDLFGDGYIIADDGSKCPPFSGQANVLNS